MSAKDRFEAAVAVVPTLTKRPANQELSLLYGLYKQATVGDNPNQKPQGFDIVSMAKHEGWASVRGMPKEEAMNTYADKIDALVAEE